MKRTVTILLFLITTYALQAENSVSAKTFLQMKPDDAFKVIAEMSREDSQTLITQIRKEAKADYKQIDNFYFLISHLEEIKAVEIEQSRLKSLNLVYILGLTLLLSFIMYVFISQRKIIRELNALK